nr:MAG: hypothetical protein [Hangzhou rhabdovirus 1]
MLFILHLLLIQFASGSGDPRNLTVLLRLPETEILSQLPPLPSCYREATSTISSFPAEVGIWSISSSLAKGSGTTLTCRNMTIQCTYYFFGAQEQENLNTIEVDCPDHVIASFSTSSTYTPLNPPAFDCNWPGTRVITTMQVFVQPVSFYIGSDLLLRSQGRIWASHKANIYRAGSSYLKTGTSIPSCPFRKIRDEMSVIHPINDSLSVMNCPLSGFHLKFYPRNPICSVDGKAIFSTDGVVFVSYGVNHSSVINLSMKILKDPKLSKVALQTNFNFKSVEKTLNKNLQLIEEEICLSRQFQYIKAYAARDLKEIGFLLTGDPFSKLEETRYGYLLTTHAVRTVTATLDNIREKNGTSFYCFNGTYEFEIHYLSGISGDKPGPESRSGMIALSDNTFYSLRLQQVVAGYKEFKLEHWKAHLLESSSEDFADSYSDVLNLTGQYGSWFSDAYMWINSQLMWVKVAFALVLISLIVYCVRRCMNTCGCSRNRKARGAALI